MSGQQALSVVFVVWALLGVLLLLWAILDSQIVRKSWVFVSAVYFLCQPSHIVWRCWRYIVSIRGYGSSNAILSDPDVIIVSLSLGINAMSLISEILWQIHPIWTPWLVNVWILQKQYLLRQRCYPHGDVYGSISGQINIVMIRG